MAEDPRTLHIHQGTTYRVIFLWEDNAVPPVPISLVGLTGRFRLMHRAGGTPFLEATSTDGRVVLQPGGATGEVHIRLPVADTIPIKRSGAYEMDLIETGDPTEVAYLVGGPFTLIKAGA